MSKSSRSIGIASAAFVMAGSSWCWAEPTTPEVVVVNTCRTSQGCPDIESVRGEVVNLYTAGTASASANPRAAVEIAVGCDDKGEYSVVVSRLDDPKRASRTEEGFATCSEAMSMAVPMAAVLLTLKREEPATDQTASETNSIVPARESEPPSPATESVSEPDRSAPALDGRDQAEQGQGLPQMPEKASRWSWSASGSAVAATGATKWPTAGGRLGIRARVDNVSFEVQGGGDLTTEVNPDTIASRIVATGLACGHKDPAFGCLTASTGVIRRGEGGTTIADNAGPFAAAGVRVGLETPLFWRLSGQASGGIDILLTDPPAAEASRMAGFFAVGLVLPISF